MSQTQNGDGDGTGTKNDPGAGDPTGGTRTDPDVDPDAGSGSDPGDRGREELLDENRTLRERLDQIEAEQETLKEALGEAEDQNEVAAMSYAEKIVEAGDYNGVFDADELAAKFSLSELRDKFSAVFGEGAGLGDADTTKADYQGATGAGAGKSLDSLSAEDRQAVETMRNQIDTWEHRESMSEFVEDRKEKIADLTGREYNGGGD